MPPLIIIIVIFSQLLMTNVTLSWFILLKQK